MESWLRREARETKKQAVSDKIPTMTKLQAGSTQPSRSWPWCPSSSGPVVAGILLNQFKENFASSCLINFLIPLPNLGNWSPWPTSGKNIVRFVYPDPPPYPWCHLQIISHPLTPTLLLGHKSPLAHAVCRIELSFMLSLFSSIAIIMNKIYFYHFVSVWLWFSSGLPQWTGETGKKKRSTVGK